MAEKVLVEKQIINSLLKSIDIHLEVLSEAPIFIQDSFYKNKIIKSLEHLKSAADLLRPSEKEIAEMKRRSYFRYSTGKKELEDLKKNCVDKELIDLKEKEVRESLELYIALKDTYTKMININRD